MSLAITTGSLALGAVSVDRLAFMLRDQLVNFYGADISTADSLGTISGSQLTIGQLTAAVIALLTAIAFVATERRRLRHLRSEAAQIKRARRVRALTKLGTIEWIEMLVERSSVYSAVLMATYVFDASYERWAGGYGFGLGINEWQSALPLASVYGLCVIAALVTGTISMVGLRALTSLKELGRACIRAAVRRIAALPRPDLSTPPLRFSELLGTTLLSRPPPECALA